MRRLVATGVVTVAVAVCSTTIAAGAASAMQVRDLRAGSSASADPPTISVPAFLLHLPSAFSVVLLPEFHCPADHPWLDDHVFRVDGPAEDDLPAGLELSRNTSIEVRIPTLDVDRSVGAVTGWSISVANVAEADQTHGGIEGTASCTDDLTHAYQPASGTTAPSLGEVSAH